MQTFLPYADFKASAKILDSRRLGKQRVEAYQILNTLCGKSKGWKNHPAVRMWRGYEPALTEYMNTIIQEWKDRGFMNTMQIMPVTDVQYPPWLGEEVIHFSHRCNLARKDPTYKILWPDANIEFPYYWPV